MEFVPYEQFKDIEFISEGGFSKVYKATWINGPVSGWNNKNNCRISNYTVVLKKFKNSINITSKELNELKVFYYYSSKWKHQRNDHVCKYFGITQDPDSQDFVIIMPYYSKSATEFESNENYGIIPYMAPETFQGQKYTKASDVYSYIKLMNQCWHSDPNKRPKTTYISEKINKIWNEESKSSTDIIESSDIGPIKITNSGAIYKSRHLNAMINSVMSLRSSRSQFVNLEEKVKRKFEDNLIKDNNEEDYLTKELELDIDLNFNDNGK
ncbi:kinase-like domain-containing protein [Rhizophagus clarus]|uniref:Kinase-like domain-containing protein n=1 Tax=Rhizophagus clarus TaxID=94130 RepID=A0A8H3LV33_9GLOM|nr:kinase-like domain-containing protein [Rhizophagus clarus]